MSMKKSHEYYVKQGRRNKRRGARGELELAKKLNEYGFNCNRTRQYCGKAGNADVEGLPDIHIECKRVEKLNIYNAIEQAIVDAHNGNKPTVFHRKNNKDWLVTMRLEDWIGIYKDHLETVYLKGKWY